MAVSHCTSDKLQGKLQDEPNEQRSWIAASTRTCLPTDRLTPCGTHGESGYALGAISARQPKRATRPIELSLKKNLQPTCDERSRCETGGDQACTCTSRAKDPGQRSMVGPSAVMMTGGCYGLSELSYFSYVPPSRWKPPELAAHGWQAHGPTAKSHTEPNLRFGPGETPRTRCGWYQTRWRWHPATFCRHLAALASGASPSPKIYLNLVALPPEGRDGRHDYRPKWYKG